MSADGAGEALRDGARLLGRRILLVEDDALIAMEMATLLAACGAVVLGPHPTVAAALAALAAAAPSCAVLDVELRGEPVTPVALTLRRAGAPFVLTSGYVGEQIDAPELQGAPLLTKPIEREALLRALERMLVGR